MATYNGSDKRLQYLFQNGGGGGVSECLYDATKIDGLVSSMARANASLAEILRILEGGGGGGGGFTVKVVEPINGTTFSSIERVEVEEVV